MSKLYFIKERKTPNELKNLTKGTECEITEEILKELYECPGFFKKSVAFVGKYTLKNHDVIYSCPKYFDDSVITNAAKGSEKDIREISEHIKLILNVLLKLENKDPNIIGDCIFSPGEKKIRKNFVQKLSLSEFILKDYLNNGLYFEEQHLTNKQSYGKISWNRTVQKVIPYINDNNVVYLKLIRKYNTKNYNTLLSLIHASVIHHAYEFIKNFGGYKNITLPDVVPISEEELGKDEFVHLIRKHMLTVYSNREIFLLRALEAWCTKSVHYDRFVFGSTSFEMIWQNVGDSVWGNDRNTDSEKPLYSFFVDRNKYKYKDFYAGGESKIDTLRIIGNKEKPDIVAIFDSKYYVPLKERYNLQNGDLNGYPSNSDISKQVGYLRLKKEQYGTKPQYSNAFLLPRISDRLIDELGLPNQMKYGNWQNNLYNISGFATRGSYSENRDTSPVLLIHVDPTQLYELYLQNDGTSVPDEDIEKIAQEYAKSEDTLKKSSNKT